jgi:hypothetical protein
MFNQKDDVMKTDILLNDPFFQWQETAARQAELNIVRLPLRQGVILFKEKL